MIYNTPLQCMACHLVKTFIIRLTHANVWESMGIYKSHFLLRVTQESVSGTASHATKSFKRVH